jgi:hypothetical protein
MHGKVFRVGGLLLTAARDLVQRGHSGFAGRTMSGVGRGLRILDTCVLTGFGCRCANVCHHGFPSRPACFTFSVVRVGGPAAAVP